MRQGVIFPSDFVIFFGQGGGGILFIFNEKVKGFYKREKITVFFGYVSDIMI